MLKILRNKSIQKRIYWVLAAAIVLPFAFWGINPSTEKTKFDSSLGVIDGRRISAQEYLAGYKAVDHQLKLMFGEKASKLSGSINLKGEAWDRLLLLHKAKKEKIYTGDDEVVNWIAGQSAFSRQGRFDDQFYNLFVQRYLGISSRQFEEEIRGTLTIEKLLSKLGSKSAVGDEELKELYQKTNLDREIAYAVIGWETLRSEKGLKDELREKFVQQKTTDLALKKLKELKAKLTPANFESALVAEKLDVKRFEAFKPGAYVPGVGPAESLENALKNLKEGEISDAVAVPTGAAIIKILKDKPLDQKKFDAEKEAFRKQVVDEKAREAIGNYIEKLRTELKLNPEAMKALFSDES